MAVSALSYNLEQSHFLDQDLEPSYPSEHNESAALLKGLDKPTDYDSKKFLKPKFTQRNSQSVTNLNLNKGQD